MGIEQIVVEQLSAEIGVELKGVDFESMAPTRPFIDLIKRLLDEHRLVVIRRQKIQPVTAQEFTGNFGPLLDIKRQGSGAVHVPEAEWIKVFSNGKTADGRLPGDGNSSAQFWHTDFTPWEAPVGHIAIYCRQTVEPAPDRAGHPPERPLAAAGGPQNQDAASSRASPSWHRRPILYLPTRRDSLIPGMDEAESGALLTDLSDFVDFAHGLDLATLPGEVLRQSRLNILDTLGCIAAGVTEQGRAAWSPWGAGCSGGHRRG